MNSAPQHGETSLETIEDSYQRLSSSVLHAAKAYCPSSSPMQSLPRQFVLSARRLFRREEAYLFAVLGEPPAHISRLAGMLLLLRQHSRTECHRVSDVVTADQRHHARYQLVDRQLRHQWLRR